MRHTTAVTLLALRLAALSLAACGGGSASHSNAARVAQTTTSTPSTTTAASTPAPAAPPPKLRIVAPHNGASTLQTVTARVRLTGGKTSGAKPFRYSLDGSITRLGSARLTFTGLAPGHHHLTVTLASNRSVRATVSFDVAAPPPPPTTTVAPTPTTITHTTAPPPPTTTTHTPSSGIPQGPNAGDGDSDNHGGPSDGDGNI